MKAVVYRGPRHVTVEDVPLPRLTGPRDAVVRVTASAICGTDIHPFREHIGGFEPGTILGHEFTGTVVEAGSEVPYPPGERVFASDVIACGRCVACLRGMHYHCSSVGLFGTSTLVGRPVAGAQAEHVRVPFADIVLRPIPSTVTDEQALFVGDGLSTAYTAVRAANVRPGDVVAVVGAGPIGVLTAMCARVAGASEVVVADLDPARQDAHGGRAVHPQHLESVVRELTGGWGAHVVVEAVGSPGALRCAVEAAGPGATVVAVGVHHSDAMLPAATVFARELTLRFVVGDPIAVREPTLALISSGQVDPAALISHRLPLSAAEKAYEMVEKHKAFKVVLFPEWT